MRHTEKNNSKKRENEITYGNELVGVVHHGYEHVQQHNKGDDVVGPKHSGPNKFCELMSGFHVGDIEIQQTKHRPEERLEGLEKSANKTRFLLGYLTLGNGKQRLVQVGYTEASEAWGTTEWLLSTAIYSPREAHCTPATVTHWPTHLRTVSYQQHLLPVRKPCPHPCEMQGA